MGESGSGKSTIIQLLLRLYEPSAGAVLLDGRDVRTLPLVRLTSVIRVSACMWQRLRHVLLRHGP